MMWWHCLECWEEFDEETVGHRDDGIGPYEYWGMKGVDKHIVETCPHCGELASKGPLPSCEDCGETLTAKEHNEGTRCRVCLESERFNGEEAE